MRLENKKLTKYLFLISLAVNIIFIVSHDPYPLSKSDQVGYEVSAINILDKGTYIDEFDRYAFRAPLYPLMISGVYAIFGKSKLMVYLVQAIFAALSSILVYKIVKLLSNIYGGIIGWSLMTFSPLMIIFIEQILRGTTIFLWIVSGLYVLFLARARKYEHFSQSLVFGVIMGLGLLLMPSALLWIMFYFAFIFFDGKAFCFSRLKWVGISILVFFLTVSPWLIRNYKLFNKVVITSSFGHNLYVGNHSSVAEIGYELPLEGGNLPGVTGEIQREEVFQKRALNFIKNNPKDALASLPRKLYYFFKPSNNLILIVYYYFFAALLGGCIIAAIKHPSVNYILLLTPFLLRIFTALIFHGEFRYRIHTYPHLFIFIAIVIGNFLSGKNHNQGKQKTSNRYL